MRTSISINLSVKISISIGITIIIAIAIDITITMTIHVLIKMNGFDTRASGVPGSASPAPPCSHGMTRPSPSRQLEAASPSRGKHNHQKKYCDSAVCQQLSERQ